MPEEQEAIPPARSRRRARRESDTMSRLAAGGLLLGGGLVLTLYAMRLVAAAFGCGFSPFVCLGMPESRGAQALALLTLVAGCVALLALVLRDTRDELWLEAADGGVLVPADALERLLRDAALAHPDVLRAEVRLGTRGGKPSAVMHVDLRPLADPGALGAQLAGSARDVLARVTGVSEAAVRVRCRTLAVSQLARRLP